MKDFIVIAFDGKHIKCHSEIAPLPTKTVKPDAWHMNLIARELIRDVDYQVFGDDYRWLHASTPKRAMERRWGRAVEAIDAVIHQAAA